MLWKLRETKAHRLQEVDLSGFVLHSLDNNYKGLPDNQRGERKKRLCLLGNLYRDPQKPEVSTQVTSSLSWEQYQCLSVFRSLLFYTSMTSKARF